MDERDFNSREAFQTHARSRDEARNMAVKITVAIEGANLNYDGGDTMQAASSEQSAVDDIDLVELDKSEYRFSARTDVCMVGEGRVRQWLDVMTMFRPKSSGTAISPSYSFIACQKSYSPLHISDNDEHPGKASTTMFFDHACLDYATEEPAAYLSRNIPRRSEGGTVVHIDKLLYQLNPAIRTYVGEEVPRGLEHSHIHFSEGRSMSMVARTIELADPRIQSVTPLRVDYILRPQSIGGQ